MLWPEPKRTARRWRRQARWLQSVVVRFDYYERLSKPHQAIYRKSDRTTTVALPDLEELAPLVEALRESLLGQRCAAVQRAAKALTHALLTQLNVPSARVRVLAARPVSAESELHGLYERDDDDGRAVISVWMRTASKKQVVAFRTFVRTLLHELCHHLDYDHLKLADSFHTEGFFKRESSLAKQLIGERAAKPAKAKKVPKKRAQAKQRRRMKQLELPFYG
jgi:hypothetical protein